MNNWNDYLKITKGGPRPLLVEALAYTSRGKALDLGCGAGNDSCFLKKNGFKVVSVDSNKEVGKLMPEAVISSIEDFNFENGYSLINAQYALPFCNPREIDKVMDNITNAIAPGGIFAGQFFGPEDSWSKHSSMNFQAEKEVRNFFKDFQIIKLLEEKKSKTTALGEPHFWHIFHVIAKKHK